MLLLSLFLFLISVGRLLRGVSVVAELNRFGVSLVGILFIVLSLGALVYWTESSNHTFAYLQYQYGLKNLPIQPY
ncbi:MAG: hypothetical protein RML35_06345 [Chloroherpetonaceae bacterium]|nr:hypothetical protein [Chloroherpetonaceae bacterium]